MTRDDGTGSVRRRLPRSATLSAKEPRGDWRVVVPALGRREETRWSRKRETVRFYRGSAASARCGACRHQPFQLSHRPQADLGGDLLTFCVGVVQGSDGTDMFEFSGLPTRACMAGTCIMRTTHAISESFWMDETSTARSTATAGRAGEASNRSSPRVPLRPASGALRVTCRAATDAGGTLKTRLPAAASQQERGAPLGMAGANAAAPLCWPLRIAENEAAAAAEEGVSECNEFIGQDRSTVSEYSRDHNIHGPHSIRPPTKSGSFCRHEASCPSSRVCFSFHGAKGANRLHSVLLPISISSKGHGRQASDAAAHITV
jgi:hypothetical protein